MSPRPFRSIVLALLLGGVSAAPAVAQPGWVLPSSLLISPTPPVEVGQPVVASDDSGEALALFTQGEPGGLWKLFYENHQPGAQWSAPAALSAGESPGQPALAMSAQGDATAAWTDKNSPSSPWRVWTSERTPGDAWSAPVALEQSGAASDVILAGPLVAEDEAGDALVTWVEAVSGYTPQWVVGAYRHDGVWSKPVRLSEPALYVQQYQWRQSALVANAAGDFVLVWAQEDETGTFSVQAQEFQDGVFSGAQTIESSPDRLYGVSAAENAAGEAAAIWADESTAEVHAASFRGGAWSVIDPPGTKIRTICEQAPPKIGVDGSGNGTAVWLEEPGRLVSTPMAASGVWGAEEPVATLGGFVYDLELGVDPAGDALLDWTRDEYNSGLSRNEYFAEGASRLAGSSWSQPAVLTAGQGEFGSSADLTMDSRGNGFAAFLEYGSAQTFGRGAGFEMGPLIRSLTAPAQLAVGASGGFSADAVAPWAGVASEQWLFGDGASAQGSSVAHAYANPGTYTVMLTVTDTLGNATTTTRQVMVGATAAAPEKPSARPKLGPVYLIVAKQRFWLAAHGRVVSARIRNTNAFPVSGTATMFAHFIAPNGRGAMAALKPIASVARFSLPAKSTGVVRFRITAAGLHRLRANVPDRGHDLISVHLKIHGGGDSASSTGVYVLDQRVPPRHGPRPHASPGYRDPVDPWAHSSC